MYQRLNAFNSGAVSAVMGAIGYIIAEWEDKNWFQKIIKALFLWMALVELVLAIVIFVLALIGKIINLIPIVNVVYCFCIHIILVVAVLLGLLASIYAPKDYLQKINEIYAEGLEDAASYIEN
jgi:hypothetical protein